MKNKINFFNSDAIIRLTPIKDNTLLVANNIMNGKWKIFPTLPDLDIEDIDSVWEMKYPSTESTYSLYTYALYPLSYLLNAYEVSGDESYLDKALVISQSFISWINSSDIKLSAKRKKILFGDHSVSNRTQSLCYLLLSLNSSGRKIPSNLIEQLIIQGEYLSNIDNYSNYNHGLMMDLALLGLVNTLKGNGIDFPNFFQSNLLERLNSSLLRDVTEDGVHVENSPGYHFWIMNFYKKINKPLLELDKNLAEKCGNVLNKASEYAKYITRSDGSVPAIGDTHASLKSTPSHTLSSKFFSDSNIVIFRDLDDKVWASFNSGYKTHVHKHADDGSFNLFYKGKDIFFDPGFLNYESSEDSLMIKSASFHNTVRSLKKKVEITKQDLNGDILNKDYKENLTGSEIVGFYCDSDYEVSLAIISGYSSFDIERLVIFSKQGYFIIHDYVVVGTGVNEIFEQGFNIGSTLDLKCINNSEVIIKSIEGINLCEMKQMFRANESGFISNIRVEDAFTAESFNVKKSFKRLVFSFENRESLILVNLLDYNSNIKKQMLSSKKAFELVDKMRCNFLYQRS